MGNFFGANVRRHRLALGLSQEALGEVLGVHQTHIANIEVGNKTPSFRLVKRFADFFGVSIDEMIVQPPSEQAAQPQPEPA